MVSHELRAPLSSIKGSAATLIGSGASLDPAEMDLFFRIIEQQADHMALAVLARLAFHPGDGAAGDGHPLAAPGVARVLDVEEPSPTPGPAAYQQRAARAHREERNRKGDYAACLTDCGSSLESVLKVICTRKGLHYSENDTAATLIETVVTGLRMEGFFTQPWTLLATLRCGLEAHHWPRPVPDREPNRML